VKLAGYKAASCFKAARNWFKSAMAGRHKSHRAGNNQTASLRIAAKKIIATSMATMSVVSTTAIMTRR
jgi:hypothetical protein